MPDATGYRTSALRRFSASALVLALVVVCISCAGFGAKKNEARAHFLRGVAYLSGNRVQEAYVEFQKSLELNSRDKETHNALGNIYIRLVDYQKAEEHFKKAIRLDRKYSEAYNNLCFIYYEQDRWDDAVEKCNIALKNLLYTTPEKAFYNLGRSYYRARKYPEAIEAYTDAIRRFPRGGQLFYALALAYNARQMYGNAADAMDSAIKNDTRFRGDRDKAEMEFKKQMDIADNPQDLEDYLEILKY